VSELQYAKKNNLNTVIFNCNGRFDIKTFHSLRKFIKINKINIIHTHGYKSNFYGFLIAKFLKIPIVSTCHNWNAEDTLTRFYYRLDKLLLPWFDKVIAVSNNVKQVLTDNSVHKKKISVIYNGIDITRFENNKKNIRVEFNINSKSKIVGTVARFTEEKGLNYLIESAPTRAKGTSNGSIHQHGNSILARD